MKAITAFLLLIWSSIGFAQTASIEGRWQTANGQSIIEISQAKTGQWQGVIVESKEKQQAKSQQILSSITKTQGGYKGKIYAVKAGKHLDVRITCVDNTLLLKVKAGFLSKEVIWTRVKS